MKKEIKKGWRFHSNEKKYLNSILKSDFSAGLDNSMSEKFEHLFSKKHNQKFGISSNSGTATLHLFGVGIGNLAIKTKFSSIVLRIAGVGCALFGISLLI